MEAGGRGRKVPAEERSLHWSELLRTEKRKEQECAGGRVAPGGVLAALALSGTRHGSEAACPKHHAEAKAETCAQGLERRLRS